MTLNSSTLRPGLLVSLKTSVVGNVHYERRTIESEHRLADGASKAAWETVRVIDDPEEHEAATKARGKIRSTIASECVASSFGLLCPDWNIVDLDKAVIEARRMADDFNRTAKLSRIGVYVITGRIASDDVEAVKAINSEVTELLATMAEGVKNLDVKAIRDAADKARDVGNMLSPEAEARIQIAIDTARSAARQIVKAGETAAQEIDTKAIRKITEQRTAFLDIGDAVEVAAPTEPGRGIDFGPGETVAAPAMQARSFEV